jgi:hypothetical protein
MSVRVELTELADVTAQRPVALLATTDGTRVKVAQVFPHMVDGVVTVQVGPGSIRSVELRPDVVLIYPPIPGDPDGFTLLVDGQARVDASDRLVISATSAILHRRLPDTGQSATRCET